MAGLARLVGVVGGNFGEVVLLIGSSIVLWFVFVERQLVWCRLVVPHFNSVAGVIIHEKTSPVTWYSSYLPKGSDTFTSTLLGKALAFPRPNSLDF